MYIYENGTLGFDENNGNLTENQQFSSSGDLDHGVSATQPSSSELISTLDQVISVADVDIVSVSDLVENVDNVLVFKGDVTGYPDCYLVFSSEFEDQLLFQNGTIDNFGSSNITGVLYPSNSMTRDPEDHLLITLLGRASTQFANNVYRYGGDAYVTSYYRNATNQQLSSTQTYVTVGEMEQVTYSNNFWYVSIFLIVGVVLLFNGLRRMFTF